MPLAKLRQDYTPLQPATQAAQRTAEIGDIVPAPSPALALQRRLAQHAAAAQATDIEKWSPRRSLALIVSVSAALWLAILMAAAEAIKAVA